MEPYDELVRKAEKELALVKDALESIKKVKEIQRVMKEVIDEIEVLDPDCARRIRDALKRIRDES